MNKKKPLKQNNKTFLLILLGVFIFFVGLTLFLFRDNFKIKKNNANWGEVKEEGTINISDNEEESTPKDIYTDENGLIYERKNLYSMGISLYLPQNWTINTENPDVLYITTDDKDYPSVEIALTTQNIKSQNINELAKNMLDFIRHNLEYHSNNYSLQAKTYATNTTMLQTIYDDSKKVWVDTSDINIYEEYEAIPEGITGNWEEKSKFIGVYEYGLLNMSGSNIKASPYYSFYYTFIDNTEYFISCIGPKNYADKCEMITKTIINSIKPVESLEDIQLPSFSQDYKIQNLSFKLPKTFKSHMNNNEMIYTVSDNIKSKDFGMNVAAYVVNFDNDVLFNTDLYKVPTYKQNLFNCYTTNSVAELAKQNLDEIILSYGNETDVIIDGKNCKRYDTQLFLKTPNTELAVKSKKSYPIKGYTYVVEDGLSVYVVNFAYGNGNQAAAEKYARALIKTIDIK